MAVPPLVASDFHNSYPCVPSVAEKNNPADVYIQSFSESNAIEDPAPGFISFTITVFAAVPSVTHNSLPCVPSSAIKNTFPLYKLVWKFPPLTAAAKRSGNKNALELAAPDWI